MRCNISENQAIFCGRANYKQYYEVKTSSIFRLVELKRLYGTIIDGRGPQWLEDLAQGLQTNGVARAVNVTPFLRNTT